MVTSCKDKVVRIIDPRSNVPIIQSTDSHQSIKDSRVVWLGDQQRILTTGNFVVVVAIFMGWRSSNHFCDFCASRATPEPRRSKCS